MDPYQDSHLEEEVLTIIRKPSMEMQQHMEIIYQQNEHVTGEIATLRDTITELMLRMETQEETLQAHDESIKKLLEILQNKGMGKEEDRQIFHQMQAMVQKQEVQAANETLRTLQTKLKLVPSPSSSTVKVLLDSKDARIASLERKVNLLESEVEQLGGASHPIAPAPSASDQMVDHAAPAFKRQLGEIQRRDQEIVAMGANMKILKETHQDYQRHISVLKESLCPKEEHYNKLQADVEERRQPLEELDIRDRKINVFQIKVENLEDPLKEKDHQVDMAHARPNTIQGNHRSSQCTLSSLEDAIGDKEKEISQLRELHERELAEYKMKIHALNSEVEKLSARLDNVRMEDKLESSQSELGKSNAELDKCSNEVGRSGADWEQTRQRLARLELENKRLKGDLERRETRESTSTTFGDLGRCQAELRKSMLRLQIEVSPIPKEQGDRADIEKFIEKYDRSQNEVHSLQNKLDTMEKHDKMQNEFRKVVGEYDALKDMLNKFNSEQEKEKNFEMDRLKDRTLNSNQQLKTKLHEVSMQLDLELKRDIIDCEKLRDCHDKLRLATEELEKDNEKLRMDLTQADRQTLAHDKVHNDKNLEFERLKQKLEKALQARDATEMEAGRSAQKLEKSQIHLSNDLETNEPTKIELQQIANELARMNETIEKGKLDTLKQERDVLRAEIQYVRSDMDTQRKTMKLRIEEAFVKLQQASKERDKLANMLDKQGRQVDSIEKQIIKFEADIKQLTIEQDQLANQLEMSQDMLMNLQQEPNASETELDKQKAEITRLNNEQRRMSQDIERCTKDMRDKEITKLQQQLQVIQKEIDAQRERADKAEKLLQESERRSVSEFEQYRKVIEQETVRVDKAEKTANDNSKRIQVMEKQLQQQQMASLRKELQEAQTNLINSVTEQERLQELLEIFIHELETNQMIIMEELKRAGAPQKQRKQLEDEKRRLDEQKRQVEEQRNAVEDKARQVKEKEKALKEVEKQLDQLQETLQKAGSGAATAGELNKKLLEAQKNVEKAEEEAKRSTAEIKTLSELVQMSQEEQNAKQKQIKEVSQALKNAQEKFKNHLQANAQLEEQRKKEELEYKLDSCEDFIKLDNKNDIIAEYENGKSKTHIVIEENIPYSIEKINKIRRMTKEKDDRIAELEDALMVYSNKKR